jgi:uncharacterized protein
VSRARPGPTGALLDLHITPNAKRWALSEEPSGLRLRVDAPPVEGAANERVVELMAREILKIPRSAVSVVRGPRSRRKTLAIALSPDEVDALLRAWLDG